MGEESERRGRVKEDWGKLMGERLGRHADWARASAPPSEPMGGLDSAKTGAGRLR